MIVLLPAPRPTALFMMVLLQVATGDGDKLLTDEERDPQLVGR